ncbi:MAG: hypothetical protein ACREPM_02225, partial [Gemmatimonadaceae bacterium]
MNWMHPSFHATESFAFGMPNNEPRSRVSRHLLSCPRCQAESRELRSLAARTRAMKIPPMSADLRTRVVANALAGGVGILPTFAPMAASRRSILRWIIAATAAAAVISVTLMPRNTLVAGMAAGSLSLSQLSFGDAPAMDIRYTPGALLAGADRVVLRVSTYRAHALGRPESREVTLARADGAS